MYNGTDTWLAVYRSGDIDLTITLWSNYYYHNYSQNDTWSWHYRLIMTLQIDRYITDWSWHYITDWSDGITDWSWYYRLITWYYRLIMILQIDHGIILQIDHMVLQIDRMALQIASWHYRYYQLSKWLFTLNMQQIVILTISLPKDKKQSVVS